MARFRKYPCSSDSSIMLGVKDGILKDVDAALFRTKISSQKTPLHNYNVKQYVSMADGHTLVTGILGVNYVAAGYMYGLIELASSASFSPVELPSEETPPSAVDIFSTSGTTPQGTIDTYAQTPVFHNVSYLTLEWQVKVSSTLYTFRVYDNVSFLDSETAVDAKTGDPILEVFTFIANLGQPKHISLERDLNRSMKNVQTPSYDATLWRDLSREMKGVDFVDAHIGKFSDDVLGYYTGRFNNYQFPFSGGALPDNPEFDSTNTWDTYIDGHENPNYIPEENQSNNYF